MAEDVEQQLRDLATQVEQLVKHGDKEQALSLAQAAYDLSQHLPHPAPLSVAASLHILGECYRAMGLYEQALPLVHQALTLRHEVLDLSHPLVAASMHTLGDLHQESLMAVDSTICGYIRARTGDTHAAAEIIQETRLYLCGYIRARTDGAHAAEEVTQEAFHALVSAGFAKYDPAKGRLTTYARGCAHLMLMRYYTEQQHRSRVTMLLSEFRTRYSGFNAEADTRDVLERLPAAATPSRETAVIATEESHLRQQVLDELYRITFAGGLCPPHEVIALGFCKLWRAQVDEESGPSPEKKSVVRWPLRRMVTELSDTPLAILHTQIEDELVEKSELPAERVRTHLSGLRESMAHGMDRLVHTMLPQQRATQPATAEQYPMYTLRRWMCAFAANALQRQVAEEISTAEYEHLL